MRFESRLERSAFAATPLRRDQTSREGWLAQTKPAQACKRAKSGVPDHSKLEPDRRFPKDNAAIARFHGIRGMNRSAQCLRSPSPLGLEQVRKG